MYSNHHVVNLYKFYEDLQKVYVVYYNDMQAAVWYGQVLSKAEKTIKGGIRWIQETPKAYEREVCCSV